MEPKIVIVGVGQLGSRYLQGLIPIPTPLSIVAVDPNEDSVALAVKRWSDAGGSSSGHSLSASGDLESLDGSVDLAIVATSSGNRLDVTRRLNAGCKVDNWILEKMLSSSPDGVRAFRNLFAGRPSVWVNLPRRVMSWHASIRAALADKGPFSFTIAGSGFGLLTNSIHYLDLVGWLSNSSAIDIDLELGSGGFFESKRSGYVECDGNFRATYSDGTTALISCRAPIGINSPLGNVSIDIIGPQGHWTVDEANGCATGPDGEILNGRLQFQSEITAELVASILAGDGSSLPKLTEVSGLHEKILQAIQLRWEQSPIFPSKEAPVT